MTIEILWHKYEMGCTGYLSYYGCKILKYVGPTKSSSYDISWSVQSIFLNHPRIADLYIFSSLVELEFSSLRAICFCYRIDISRMIYCKCFQLGWQSCMALISISLRNNSISCSK